MKNPNRWDNLSWPQVKELAQKEAIVIIPAGSTEQHGPHLPVGCDAILATAISERAAAELNSRDIPCVVAPTIAVANSTHHMSFAGSMTLTPDLYIQVLTQYCRCITSHGFKKIAVVNGHGGNTDPTNTALITINEELGFPVWFMGYWVGTGELVAKTLETQTGMIHACEGETALMLAIDEDLVDPIYKETSGPMEHGGPGVSTFRRMEAYTENGVLGNSFKATKEKGDTMVAAMTRGLADTLKNLWE